jgi:hypothetical protein
MTTHFLLVQKRLLVSKLRIKSEASRLLRVSHYITDDNEPSTLSEQVKSYTRK